MIEMTTENGKLQTNADLFVHYLRKTGSGSTVSGYGFSLPSACIVPSAGLNKPIYAIHSSSGVGFVGVNSNNDPVFACGGGPGTYFEYFIYDTISNLSPSNFGLEIYNNSGLLSFSANYIPMKGLSIINSSNPGPLTFNGKKLAAATMSYAGRRIPGPLFVYDANTNQYTLWDEFSEAQVLRYFNDGKVNTAIISNSGQTIETTPVSYEDIIIDAGNSSNYYLPPNAEKSADILVLDVTNIPIGTTYF